MIGEVFRPWIKFSKRAHRLKMAYSARRDGVCRIFGIAPGQGTYTRGRLEQTTQRESAIYIFDGAGYATLEIAPRTVGCAQ